MEFGDGGGGGGLAKLKPRKRAREPAGLEAVLVPKDGESAYGKPLEKTGFSLKIRGH